jgi:hypothetical protein
MGRWNNLNRREFLSKALCAAASFSCSASRCHPHAGIVPTADEVRVVALLEFLP